MTSEDLEYSVEVVCTTFVLFWACHYTLNAMYKKYEHLLYLREETKSIGSGWNYDFFSLRMFGCTVPLRAHSNLLSVWRWFVMFMFHFMMEPIGTYIIHT